MNKDKKQLKKTHDGNTKGNCFEEYFCADNYIIRKRPPAAFFRQEAA
jgi:hypothetical protein